MQIFTLLLRFTAPVFLLVGALHLALGVGAEVMLGAKLPSAALSDAVLDRDRKSTRLNSSHPRLSRMPSSA